MNLKTNFGIQKMGMAQFIKLSCLFLLSCKSLNTANHTHIVFKDLPDYRIMTDYLIKHNYHHDFNETTFIDKYNTSDDTILNFLKSKNIMAIHVLGRIDFSNNDELKLYEERSNGRYTDSVIEYHFYYVPIFGKRWELNFDFSSRVLTKSYDKDGVSYINLDNRISYIKY